MALRLGLKEITSMGWRVERWLAGGAERGAQMIEGARMARRQKCVCMIVY